MIGLTPLDRIKSDEVTLLSFMKPKTCTLLVATLIISSSFKEDIILISVSSVQRQIVIFALPHA